MMDSISLSYIKSYIKTNELKTVIYGAGYLGSQWGYKFLTNSGIAIDFYSDSNKELWNTEINGISIISTDDLISFGNGVFVFVIMGHFSALHVVNELRKNGIKNMLTYSELLEMQDVIYDYFPFMEEDRVAVYTCVTEDYDDLKMHKYVADNWDMYVITDNPEKYLGKYNTINLYEYVPDEIRDPTRQNRYCKLHPHVIFPEYKYSIYYDANVVFIDDFSVIFNTLPCTKLAVASKLFVNSIYKEAIRIINARRDDPEVIKNQMKKYWIQGMPDNFGQYWNYVLVREHNNPICVRLMDEWWNEIEKYSKRDQLSLPYVIWKNGYSFCDVGIIDGYDRFWERNSGHKRGESRV